MPSKSSKDTNAPKKPLSAYLLFSADERPKLKASGLDNFAEISKALGAAWKQADHKIRTHYEKEHEREKVRYDNELKEYQQSGQPAPSSAAALKPPPPTTTSKPKSTATSKANAKVASAPISPVKNVKHHNDEEDDDDDDSEAESEEEESDDEPPPPPPPPAKNGRKKN